MSRQAVEFEGQDEPIPIRSSTSGQSVHPALQDIDPSTRFFYTPHTLTGLSLGELACCSIQETHALLIEFANNKVPISDLLIQVCLAPPVTALTQFTVCEGIAALIYLSGALDADSPAGGASNALESNIRSGLLGAAGVFLGAVPCHELIFIVVVTSL